MAVAGGPLLTHPFDQLIALGADERVVVGSLKAAIIDHDDDVDEAVPITDAHQREQNGLAHALLTVEEYIDDDVMLILGDRTIDVTLLDVVKRQREDRADAAFLVAEVLWEEASRYGVCDTNQYGEITDVVAKPDDPPSKLVMTGFYTFSPAIFHACHLVQPSGRGEYEISEGIDLLIQNGRTIDAIPLDGWRVDVGYPADREEAEARLKGEFEVGVVEATDRN